MNNTEMLAVPVAFALQKKYIDYVYTYTHMI